MRVTDATLEALVAIRDGLKPEGVVASDRRWKKSIRLAQAAAHLAGAAETTPEDLSFLADSLWREPKDRAKVARSPTRPPCARARPPQDALFVHCDGGTSIAGPVPRR